eukprot:EG_transcript_7126
MAAIRLMLGRPMTVRTSLAFAPRSVRPRWFSTPAAPTSRVEARAEQIYTTVLQPIDYYGLVPKERTSLPMVMLLGNHSSGKSTFINYLLNCREQETGVAPTDDGFTVITRGTDHADQDGPALMSDAKWAFGELKVFGPSFLNHFKLKQRVLPASSLLPPGLMVVDTPGMIDTPLKGEQQRRDNRGYDFLKVVRWFAERSDAILLLFDPNNPGTTGETLDVLTEALVDMDHKLLVILNKVDQFDQVHDFARAYGSLCWNLAKVIRRKDIPRIYTMFTPTAPSSPGQDKPQLPIIQASKATVSAADSAYEHNADGAPITSRIPLLDFNRTRDEVVAEILKAPQRRLDNLVTALHEAVSRVHLAGTISNAVRSGYRQRVFQYYAVVGLSLVLGPSTMGGCIYLGLPFLSTLTACGTTFSALGLLNWMTSKACTEYKDTALASLDTTFHRLYYKQVDEDHDLVARWDRLKPKLYRALSHMEISQVPAIKQKTLDELQTIMAKEIRELRRECAETRGSAMPVPPGEGRAY